MKSEVYRAIRSAHIPHASKLMGLFFTVQVDNGPKYTVKAMQDFLKKLNVVH